MDTMKRTWKKAIALFLAVVMAISFAPSIASRALEAPSVKSLIVNSGTGADFYAAVQSAWGENAYSSAADAYSEWGITAEGKYAWGIVAFENASAVKNYGVRIEGLDGEGDEWVSNKAITVPDGATAGVGIVIANEADVLATLTKKDSLVQPLHVRAVWGTTEEAPETFYNRIKGKSEEAYGKSGLENDSTTATTLVGDVPTDLTVKMSGEEGGSYTDTFTVSYDGTQKKPFVKVYLGETELTKDLDYTVNGLTGKTDAGTYEFTVSPVGANSSTKIKVAWTIEAAADSTTWTWSRWFNGDNDEYTAAVFTGTAKYNDTPYYDARQQ